MYYYNYYYRKQFFMSYILCLNFLDCKELLYSKDYLLLLTLLML